MKKLSVTQYAEMHNCTRQNVLKKIKKPTLKHDFEMIGNTYVIYVPSNYKPKDKKR
jgi:RNA-binding protein YhbY